MLALLGSLEQIRNAVHELEQYVGARYKRDLMTKRSGPTKSYKQRIEDGLRPVFVWLSPQAAEALDHAVAESGGTMTSVIEQLLLENGPRNRPPPEPPKPAPKPPTAVKATPVKSSPQAARVAEGGMRRQAVIVKNGAIASDGRIRSGPR